ncbi:hypothetical protein GCM10010402_66080 [Actinomadura luteofluorescens]
MESDFSEAGRGAARELGRGLDRAAGEAGQAGERAGGEFVRGADGRLRNARGQFVRAGREAGDSFTEGAGRSIRGSGSELGGAGRRAGRQAGEGLGDGAEAGGKGRFGKLGGKLAGLMAKAGPWLAAGAVVGGIFMTGLAGAMEKQDAVAKLDAQVGAYGPRSGELGRVAGALYAGAYGESMGDVTDAIRAVMQNIGGMSTASEADLRKVSGAAMDLATIMDEEVGGVSRAVGTMLRTGMARNAQEAFDILTRGVQTGANKAEDLLDTFVEYSTQFRKLGLDGQSAMGLISQGLKAGARDADTVADALKEFSIRAIDGSKASVEGFKSLGLNAEKMAAQIAEGGKPAAAGLQIVLNKLRAIKDPVKREAAAVALFGTKAEDLGKALYSLNPSKATQALGKVGGAADKAGKTLHETASARLTQFERTAKGKLVDLVGGKILPALTAFGGKVGPVFQKGIGEIRKWLDENQDKIQEWADKIQKIATLIGGIISAGLTVAAALWRVFGGTILKIVTIFIDTLLGYWTGIFTMILGVWNVFAGIFTGDWGRVWKGIKQIFSGALQAVGSILKGALLIWLSIFKITWTVIGAIAKWTWGKIVSFVKWGIKQAITHISWLAKIPSLVGGFFGRMAAAAISKALQLVRWMGGLPGRIRRGLGSLGRLLYGAGRDILSGLWNGIQSMGGWVRDRVSGLINSIIPGPVRKVLGIASPSKVLRKIGTQIMQGLHAGLTSSEASKVKATVTRTAGLIAKAFKGRKTSVDDRLIDGLKRNNGRLQGIAKKRAALLAKIAAAKDYAKTVTNTAREFASIGNVPVGDSVRGGDLVQGMQTRLAALQQFGADIKRLAKSGLSKTVLRQIIDAGPEEGGKLAAALASGGKQAIGEINRTQAEINRVSQGLGLTSADSLYDAGKNASRGFLRGLQSQEKALAKQMGRIASNIVRAIRRALKIHSPSQVTAELGGHVSAGLAAGMVRGGEDVARAASHLATVAVPTVQQRQPFRVSAAAGSPAGRPAAADDREVRLVLDLRGGDRKFKEWMRNTVRVEGRGSVQVAFGGER